MLKNKKSLLQSPYIWSFSTYFAEGFPYTIIRQISSLFLRDMGIRLESIGLTSLYGLPWIFKFLWGPLIDRYGTKRLWMLIMQGLLAISLVLTAAVAPLQAGPTIIALLFFVASFFAATNDVAIDGYYMEALDIKGQATYVGYRVMAYRIAMITGTGIIGTIGTTINWTAAFSAAALIFTVFFLYHYFFLPRVETPQVSLRNLVSIQTSTKILWGTALISGVVIGIRSFFQSAWYTHQQEIFPVLKKIWFSHWVGLLLFISLLLLFLFRNKLKASILRNPDSFYSKAFLTFIDRKKIGVIFTVIILLRTGEFMLSSMVAPFFVDLGIKVHYGWIASAVGLPFSIMGALAGGWMIARFSLKTVIWPFLLLQNLTNLVYMGLALFLAHFISQNTGAAVPQSIGVTNITLVAATHAFDQFAGGLGTAVLMTFLMRICSQEFKAAHYAIGTGLMNISSVITGVAGGFLCSWLGYGWFFGISFVLSVPGMTAVLFLPEDIYRKET